MTDHPNKPIARYDVDNSGETASEDGPFVLYADHEAALAAEREVHRGDIDDLNEIHRERLAAKDARIAELESLVDAIFADLDMRAKMEGPDEPLGIGSGLVHRYDRDLKQRRKRALLEKTP